MTVPADVPPPPRPAAPPPSIVRLTPAWLLAASLLLISSRPCAEAASSSGERRTSASPSSLSAVGGGGTNNKHAAALGPFRPSAVRNLVRQRCDGGGILDNEHDGVASGLSSITSSRKDGLGDGSAVWVYEGSLVDPNTGKTVAEVEGLELVRHLSDCVKSSKGKRGRKRLGELMASDMLFGASSPTMAAEKGFGTDSKGDGQKGGKSKSGPPPSEAAEWDYAATVLSRKLFCYRSPQRASSPESGAEGGDADGSNGKDFLLPPPRRSLLRTIRLHPHSPRRRIPLDQSVALYDSATTYVSRDGGREMAVLTEWPDGRWILGSARAGPVEIAAVEASGADGGGAAGKSAAPAGGNFDFSVHVRRSTNDRPELRSLQSSSSSLSASTSSRRGWKGRKGAARDSTAKSGGDSDVIISPPRSKMVEFGRDATAEVYRYSARETYSYTLPSAAASSASSSWFQRMGRTFGRTNARLGREWDHLLGNYHDGLEAEASEGKSGVPQPTVRYSRYGECPPWYGPGRTCALELRGRRIASLSDAPALVATLAAERVPGFTVVDAPLPTGARKGRGGGSGGRVADSDTGWLLGSFYSWRRSRSSDGGGSSSRGMRRADLDRLLAQSDADDAACNAVRRFQGKTADSLPLQIVDDDFYDGDDALARTRRRNLALSDDGGGGAKWRQRLNFVREDAGRWGGKWGGRIWDAATVNAGTSGRTSSSSEL